MNAYRRVEAGRHRAIETRIWSFLESLDSDSTRLFFYLWAGPHSQPFGILDLPEPYILHDLHWKAARVRRAWSALEMAGLVWRDGNLVVLVHFLMANPPANENVVKGWRKSLAAFKSSPIFARLYETASSWITEAGLAWLQERANVTPPLKPSPNDSRTVSKLSTQYSESSTQYSESREQGAGVQGERGEPDGALRCASPLEAASLRAPQSGHASAGERQASSNGKGNGKDEPIPRGPEGRQARIRAMLSVDDEALPGAIEMVRTLKVSEEEIRRALEDR
jgi:hypothetical protein